ncbi:hypothetical protein PV11_06131 [Exophiala sideris]|uniref:RING-CH-type domain-containing protein n=1 Tax=Exophiala sideris TaxID=1016849 RepID=A0A0D1X8M8_9EURO|nr:hypothetical protein PV11_06131 [Exophiala sideris]
MTSTENVPRDGGAQNGDSGSTPEWTYPTRTCRLCLEDVPATVSLWPPGLPTALQRPIVEYKSDEDGYGRLLKPCLCRGGMRYIHEHCLKRSRTEVARPGSLWKCHQCGYQFNFNRLTVQKFLGGSLASGILTVLAMVLVMFLLGFVADPIINFYAEPYDSVLGRENVWREVDLNESKGRLSNWAQHFMKGLVSMGVLSFLRTMILNPFQWWNLRNTGMITSRVGGRSATGRDRAVNVSWIVILMGVLSASYFFYKSVQAIIGKVLQHIGNNIVDTQLPGDDDDLKPPPGFNFGAKYSTADTPQSSMPTSHNPGQGEVETPTRSEQDADQENQENDRQEGLADSTPVHRVNQKEGARSDADDSERFMPGTFNHSGYSSALNDARSQGWSF